jgi:alkylation response protein AidB-like acyl-CoA dehydrogenase
MDLDLTPDQQLLQQTVRRFLADDGSWNGLVDLGVVGLLADGGSMVDVGVVAMETGRALYAGPWVSTAVAAASLLPDLGDRPAAVTFDGLEFVADACGAEILVVIDGDGATVVEDFTAEPVATIDPSRAWGRVTATSAGRALDGVDVGLARDRTLAAWVADGVGAAERVLEMTVDYAKQRVQFDKPIGSFQAVQHICADMLRTVEQARAGAWYALWACDAAGPDERRRAVAMAQAFASADLPQVGFDAIQVHGGVGYTWESDVHRYAKRLLTLAQSMGTADAHLDALASRLFGSLGE